MESEPNLEGLKKLLRSLGLGDVEAILGQTPNLYESWKKRSRDDWKDELKELRGNAVGFTDIYNYLNPPKRIFV
jgi:hypothetical protein